MATDWRTPSAATLAEYGPRDAPEEMPEMVGLFVGGCVERGVGSRFRAQAHAHNYKGSTHFGWVCFLGHRRLYTSKGTPSATLWHEYAHILTPNHGHDDVWRAKMIELGQKIEPHYQKKTRPTGPSSYVMFGADYKFYVEGVRGAWSMSVRRSGVEHAHDEREPLGVFKSQKLVEDEMFRYMAAHRIENVA